MFSLFKIAERTRKGPCQFTNHFLRNGIAARLKRDTSPESWMISSAAIASLGQRITKTIIKRKRYIHVIKKGVHFFYFLTYYSRARTFSFPKFLSQHTKTIAKVGNNWTCNVVMKTICDKLNSPAHLDYEVNVRTIFTNILHVDFTSWIFMKKLQFKLIPSGVNTWSDLVKPDICFEEHKYYSGMFLVSQIRRAFNEDKYVNFGVLWN
jgi:hypothetical protein